MDKIPGSILDGVARGFVFLAGYLTALGWLCSMAGHLSWLGWLALPGLAGAIWLVRQGGAGNRAANEGGESGLREPLLYWPFLLVAGFVLAAALLHPPTMLDSLTYRLPRILLWLREGRILFFDTPEPRLDYMCHAWGLCNVPVVLAAGVRYVWVWGFASWVVAYLAFWAMARARGVSALVSRRLALLASTSTFGVLQAASTTDDLMAVALLVLALYFIVRFESERRGSWINWAGFSLSLAAAVKPHYATLAAPFLVWFFFARSKPWRLYPWQRLPFLLPVLVLCSPAPTFWLNHQAYGVMTGPMSDHPYAGTSPVANVAVGTGVAFWQMLQPAVNPIALFTPDPFAGWIARSGVNEVTPSVGLRMAPVSMVDGASLGFLTTVFLLAGVFAAVRRERQMLRGWPGWTVVAAAFGFWVAVSQILPESVGRSFAGFMFLAFPLAMVGWARWSERTQQLAVFLSVLGAVTALVLNPGRPLWPVETVQALLQRVGWERAAAKVEMYLKIQDRAWTAQPLLELIPDGETRFVAMIGMDCPILPLLDPEPGRPEAALLPRGVGVAELEQMGLRYVLVGPRAGWEFPELLKHVESGGSFELVKADRYTSKVARGAEEWRLYRRNPTAPVSD